MTDMTTYTLPSLLALLGRELDEPIDLAFVSRTRRDAVRLFGTVERALVESSEAAITYARRAAGNELLELANGDSIRSLTPRDLRGLSFDLVILAPGVSFTDSLDDIAPTVLYRGGNVAMLEDVTL